jgi:DNA end-binding protein Ku
MPTTVWAGHITFGLVSFPVELQAAARRITLDFDLLHRKDGSRVKYVTFCADEDKRLEKSEIVKGYAYEKGQYVLFEPSDFAKAAPSTAKVMEIQQFIESDALDPIALDASYYVKPTEAGSRPYSLLYNTLRGLNRLGIAQMAMHNREHIVAIRPASTGLVLHTLFYDEELRSGDEYRTEKANFKSKEEQLAKTLVDSLTSDFDLSAYHDGYRERLESLIQAKKKGKRIVSSPAPKLAPVIDILEALKESIAASKRKQAPARKMIAQKRIASRRRAG